MRLGFVALVGLFVGILMIAPHLFFRWELGSAYQGVPIMRSDAEMHYLARMNVWAEGRGTGNPYILEYKDSVPNGLFTPVEAFLAIPVRLGVSVTTLNLLYKFLFPALLFVLVYALAFRLMNDRLWAITAGLLVILGYHLTSIPDLVKLAHGIPPGIEFTRYARPVNPQATSLIFFGFLHLLLSFYETLRVRWAVLLGIVLGLSFYAYLYLWSFLAAVLGCGALVFFFQKRWRSGGLLLGSLALGCAIGVPYLMGLYQFAIHPLQADVPPEFGLHASHAPRASLFGLLSAAIFFFAARALPGRRSVWSFLLALLLSSFLVINQQVVTGRELQEGHYHWYFNTPIFLFLALCSLQALSSHFRLSERRIVLALSALCVLSAGAALSVQAGSYVRWFDEAREAQRYRAAYAWLAGNAPPESVVLGNDLASELLPLYTADNAVWAPHAQYYLLPAARRAYTNDRVLREGIESARRHIRIDYLLWDALRNPEWREKIPKTAAEVFNGNGVAIFKLQ